MDKLKKALKIIILSVLVLNFLATWLVWMPLKADEIRAAEAQAGGRQADGFAEAAKKALNNDEEICLEYQGLAFDVHQAVRKGVTVSAIEDWALSNVRVSSPQSIANGKRIQRLATSLYLWLEHNQQLNSYEVMETAYKRCRIDPDDVRAGISPL